MKKSIAAAAATAALLVGGASTAHAYGYDSGSKGCTVNQTGVTLSRGNGTVETQAPGGGYKAYTNGEYTWYNRTFSYKAGGGAWWASSTHYLDNANTYGYCENGTP
ncbi:hypothetical protein [Georgenia yuyongxinii]